MPASLATLITLLGIVVLLRYDTKYAEPGSGARWLPVLWIGITGSRFVSQWIGLGGGEQNYTDGSPIDAAYFATLIALAALVVYRRGTGLGDVARTNGLVLAFILLGLVSVIWSDEPDVAAKRWIKTLGHPLMALVVLTDAKPLAALCAVLKRTAYILLPLSILFIKYLPEYGRGFDSFTGRGYFHGVGQAKNDLGMICMVFGIFFLWNLLNLARIEGERERRIEKVLSLSFLGLTLWLLKLSDGATATATLAAASLLLVALGTPLVSKRHFAAFALVAVAGALLLEASFNVYEVVLGLLDRDPSLTDRTLIWHDVLGLQQKPLLGYGFESFWLNQRLDIMWERWWWRPIQAHNGYIETYLNQGLVGLALLGALLLSTFLRISRQLTVDLPFARLRLALFLAVLMFNYTEAAFKGVAFMWTVFYFIAMERPGSRQEATLELKAA